MRASSMAASAAAPLGLRTCTTGSGDRRSEAQIDLAE